MYLGKLNEHAAATLIINFTSLGQADTAGTSSLATVWLTDDTLICNCLAAKVNDPPSTTLANTIIRFNLSIINSELKVI
jgi:hypothetical protein